MPPTRSSAAALLGADPDELDRAAAELRAAADQLDGQAGSLTAILGTVAWIGSVATWFTGQWNGTHRSRIDAAAQHIREAATTLTSNAADQRAASGRASSAGETSGSWSVSTDDRRAHTIDDLLGHLRLGSTQAEVVARAARELGDHGAAGRAIDLLSGPRFTALLEAADPVLDVGQFVVDVVTDIGDHPGLPIDELLVHGLTDAAVRFGLNEGVEEGAKFLTAAITASLVPAVGAVLAPVVSQAAGAIAQLVMGQVIEALDGATDFVDANADAAVEVYRDIKAVFGLVVDGARAVVDVVGGAADLVGEASDWIDDRFEQAGEWLVDNATDGVAHAAADVAGAVGSAGGWLGEQLGFGS